MYEDKFFCVDIETIPNQNQPDWMKEYIKEKIEHKRGANKDVIKYASLSPELGEICCICSYNSVNDTMNVFFEETEEEMLQQFWDYLKDNIDNHRFVTFNGLRFDFPYILKRSSIKNVQTFNISLPIRKYYTDKHYDILEVLSNFGQSDMYSLDVYCKIYGITKSNDIDGSDIYSLYLKKNYDTIIEKCCEDVVATKELYLRIKDYL